MDDDSDKPKWLPYVVITIWLLIAMVVGIAVLASNPNRSKALELIVQVITALSGAAAAIAAFLAVKIANKTQEQAREDKKAEVEAKQPKFRLIADYMQLLTQLGGDTSISPFYELKLTFKNIHAHPATDIRLEGKMLQEDGKVLLDFANSPVGEIDEDDTFEVKRSLYVHEIGDTFVFVRMRLTYLDGITRKECSQLIYRKFYGPYEDDDRVRIDLLEVDREEWNKYLYAQHAAAKRQQLYGSEDSS
jgi:hypothetical protein